MSSKIAYSAVRAQMQGKRNDIALLTKQDISQRASMMLKDVKYGVEFHFELTGIKCQDEENGNAKHASIIERRITKGQYFKAPCLGVRELPVKRIELVEQFDLTQIDSEFKGTHDLGIMLYGLNFHDNPKVKQDWKREYFSDNADAVFYHPYIVDGVIDVSRYKGGKI